MVVADAGLLSRNNLKLLAAEGYSFILGARIKNETGVGKGRILEQARRIKDQEGFDLQKPDGSRLIVTYSEQRRKRTPMAENGALQGCGKRLNPAR